MIDALTAAIALFVLAFAGSLIAGVVARLNFEKLIDIEFVRHREEWLKDGSPVGGAISRANSGSRLPQAGQAPQFSEWSYRTPEWVLGDREAEARLSRMRFWGKLQLRIALALIVPAIGLFLWHALAA